MNLQNILKTKASYKIFLKKTNTAEAMENTMRKFLGRSNNHVKICHLFSSLKKCQHNEF